MVRMRSRVQISFAAPFLFLAVIVVGVLFEMVMVVARNMWENKLQADFENNKSDNDTNIGFKVNFPDEINQSRN